MSLERTLGQIRLRPVADDRDTPGTIHVLTHGAQRRIELARLRSLILMAALVSAAYYFAARLGLALDVMPHPVSTLWPPPAVLLAGFLLTPTHWWWVLALAALPAHFQSQLGGGSTVPLVICFYVNNVAAALVGAALLRRIVRHPPWLDTPRSVAALVACAMLMAVFVSVLDAGAALLNRWHAVAFRSVWETHILANLLAVLAVTPPLIALVGQGVGFGRRMTAARWAELATVTVLVLAVSIGAFVRTDAGPGAVNALIYAPVPLLLWVAVRFGPAGVSAEFLLVTLVSLDAAVHGHGPFVSTSPVDNVLSLQLLLIAGSIALLSLASVVQERERAREVARLNQAHLELTLNAAAMGSWEWRLEEGTLSFSDETRDILGVPRGLIISPDQLANRVHPADRDRVEGAIDRATADGAPTEVEFRVTPEGGGVRWVLAKGRVIYDARRRPTRVLGLCADVTEWKKAEALAIGQSGVLEMVAIGEPLDRVLNSLAAVIEAQIEGLQCSILLIDRGTNRVSHGGGRALPDSCGLTRERPMCAPLAAGCRRTIERGETVITPEIGDDPGWQVCRDALHAEGLHACWSLPILSHGGTVLGAAVMYGHASRAPTEAEHRLLDTLMAMASVAIERARADEALIRSQDRYALASAAARVGVWDWDLALDTVYVDPHLKMMLGYEEHEISDDLEGWKQLAHPDDWSRTLQEAQEVIARGDERFECEYRIRHRDGSLRWFYVRATIIREDGRAVRVIGTSTDFTERRQARAELEEQQRELAHLARVAILGELSGAVAHEVNQPLSAILVNAAAAQRYLARTPADVRQATEVLDDIVSDVRRAGAVIERLRSLLRKGELKLQRLDVNDLVLDVLALVNSDLVERRVSVETRLSDGLPWALGDRVHAQQVLLNLIMNGCDAMSNNIPAERMLTIITTLAERGPTISIVDRGIGLADPVMQRMFEPFFTSKENGLGLGLTICRSIVRAHGARMGARNNPDGGATFWVEFPLEADPEAAADAVCVPARAGRETDALPDALLTWPGGDARLVPRAD